MSTLSPTSPLDYAPNLKEDGEQLYFGLTLTTWVKIAVVTALMAALFRFNLVRLWLKTNPFSGEANWGHSMVVPFIGLYYLYINREELLKKQVKPAWEGLVVLLAGILVMVYGIYPGQNDFVKDLGLVVTLYGAVLMLCGWGVMQYASFPILFLVCAIPWPGLVYSWVAGPLQHLAAIVAVSVLQITGVDAAASGTKIFIGGVGGTAGRTLNVAEACAGLRSLMTFISVGGAVAFLSSRALWQKLLITVSAVPIAIFCNVARVAGQGLLDHYVSQELSESFAHQFVGMIMLIPAFFLILLIGWCLDKVFIDEVTDKHTLHRRGIDTNRIVVSASRVNITPVAIPAQLPPRTVPRASNSPVAPRNSTRTTPVTPVVASPVGASVQLPPLSPRAQAAMRRIKPGVVTDQGVSSTPQDQQKEAI